MKDDKKGYCDSCGTDKVLVQEVEHYFPTSAVKEIINLCEICMTTNLSKQFLYPGNEHNSADVLRGLAQLGNIIRKDIKKLNNKNYEDFNK